MWWKRKEGWDKDKSWAPRAPWPRPTPAQGDTGSGLFFLSFIIKKGKISIVNVPGAANTAPSNNIKK